VQKAEAAATLQEVCVVEDKTKSGYLATLKNTGNVKETFTIAMDDKEIANSPITVAAGQTAHVLLPLDEDQTSNVSIKADEAGFALTKNVTLNCLPETPVTAAPTETPSSTTTTEKPAEVQDTHVDRPQLASTGFSVFAWMFFGGCLLIIGLGLAQLGRLTRG